MRAMPATPAVTSDFEALLTSVLPVAYRTALHLARNHADAEDAVQQASLQAWRAFHTFEAGTNFRAWFLRIVTNVCRTEFRRAKRAPHGVSLDEPDFGDAIIPIGVTRELGSPTPDLALFTELDTQEISAALASLPDEYRTVATLYFVEDLSYQEIATVVGRPIGTVRSRLHRGRKMLMRKLWELAEERGIVGKTVEEDFSEFFAEETELLVA
jgi:RNA polymerase sigma-70 factor (ECF subfamily)